MKKILFYMDSLIMGGAEKIAIDYINMLYEEKKFQIKVIINEDNGKNGNILFEKLPLNIEHKFLVNENIMSKLNLYRELKQKNVFYKIHYNYYLKRRRKEKSKIIDVIKNEEYDIFIDFYNILPKELVDQRVISWQHMTLKGYSNKSLINFEERLKKMKKLVVLNEDMKNEIIKLFPKEKSKIEIIYNFFDIDKILRLSDNDLDLDNKEKELIKEKYLFACCRIDKQKDIDTLIEAYKILKEKYNIKEKLYIAGDGDQKLRLENLVKKYCLKKDIIFLGTQKNPYIWMKNAKLFVHSSHYEGFGMVLVEALITNGMVISSDCPVGPREILENGKSGMLFPVGNKEKLVEEILEVLNSKEIIKKYRTESKRRIKDFSKEKIKEKVLNLFK